MTGCQMAHVTGLAAARHAVYERIGYDLPERGLAGAPPLRVVVGAKRHVTLTRALRLLGIGEAQEHVVPVDDQGRMRVELLEDALAGRRAPTIVCAQAGEVNTGACDDLETVVAAAHAAAPGCTSTAPSASGPRQARASPTSSGGHAGADSWATDAHKWLNVPYDCGIAICAHPRDARGRDGVRRALPRGRRPTRSATRWASAPSSPAAPARCPPGRRSARSGAEGVAEMIESQLRPRSRIAAGLADLPGCEMLNDVVLNQVLFRFGDDERTGAIVGAVQREGEAWMSPTVWDDRAAIRISVSCWRTDDDDVRRTAAAFARARCCGLDCARYQRYLDPHPTHSRR